MGGVRDIGVEGNLNRDIVRDSAQINFPLYIYD
jgi:hypothetical protein